MQRSLIGLVLASIFVLGSAGKGAGHESIWIEAEHHQNLFRDVVGPAVPELNSRGMSACLVSDCSA